MTELASLDYIVIAVLSLSGIIALIRGLTREVLSIIGWIAAFYSALFALPLLRDIVRGFISPDWIADGIILVVVFVIILIGFSLVSKAFTDKLKKSPIGMLDRLLGLVFGFSRGVVIISFAYLILLLLLPPDDHPEWVREAKSTPVLKSSTAILVRVIPFDNLSDRVPDIDNLMKTDVLKNAIDDNLPNLPPDIKDNISGKLSDKDDSAGYNEQTRELLDALIEESVE
ncbi:MAG: CvpA family protein [Pseudomonadota bacterium]|nr:CvpA family protein [Pseudomonadota bacterium]